MKKRLLKMTETVSQIEFRKHREWHNRVVVRAERTSKEERLAIFNKAGHQRHPLTDLLEYELAILQMHQREYEAYCQQAAVEMTDIQINALAAELKAAAVTIGHLSDVELLVLIRDEPDDGIDYEQVSEDDLDVIINGTKDQQEAILSKYRKDTE